MSYTPVIPPHPDDRQPPHIEPPVIPTLSPNNVPMTPAWMGHPQAQANPAVFPSTPYMAYGMQPPGSYFQPPIALPPNATPVAPVGPSGVSADWTGFPHFGPDGRIIAYHNYPQYIPAPAQPAQPAGPQMMTPGGPPMGFYGGGATPWGPAPSAFATPFAQPAAMPGMMPGGWPHTPFHPAMGQPAFAAAPAAPPPAPPPATHHRAFRSGDMVDRFDKFAEEPRCAYLVSLHFLQPLTIDLQMGLYWMRFWCAW